MTKTKIFLSTFLSSAVLLSSCYALPTKEETTGSSRLGVHLTREKDACSEWTVANIQFTSKNFLSNLEDAQKDPSIHKISIYGIPQNSLPANADVWHNTANTNPATVAWKELVLFLENTNKTYGLSFN